MTEYNGNPESGIDQFLDRSKLINAVETRQATLEELASQVSKLEADLAVIAKSRDSYMELYNNTVDYIQNSINREEWTSEELSEIFWTELADMTGIDLMLEREVTVTITWHLTVKGGDELDSYDFDSSIESDRVAIISGDCSPEIEVTN
tara:strand:+ start:292 stop:738 length:447 start_codon:yes stop_codon:yes gene_type:complete